MELTDPARITGYDLERMTAGGVVVEHLPSSETTIETDGPWLFVRSIRPGAVALKVTPAHAVVDVRACAGGASCGAT